MKRIIIILSLVALLPLAYAQGYTINKITWYCPICESEDIHQSCEEPKVNTERRSIDNPTSTTMINDLVMRYIKCWKICRNCGHRVDYTIPS